MANLIASNTVETIPSYEVAEMMDREHKEVLKMIEGQKRDDGTYKHVGILRVLEESGLFNPSDFFIESTYITSQNKKVKCYECTKMGCDMLANKMTGRKGIEFTAKYVKAFNDMQEAIAQVSQLAQQQQPLQIGPRYSYNNYWIKRELSSIKPTDIPDYVEGLLEFVKEYKPSDRLATYKITRAALEDIQTTLLELWQREMVQASLNKVNKLIELQKSYINGGIKSNMTRKINHLEEENQELREQVEALTPPERTWTTVDYNGFSLNYMYYTDQYGIKHRTKAYNSWIANFPVDEVPTREEYELYQGIDFNEPIGYDLRFVAPASYDIDNMVKSFQDQIFNRILGIDDNIVHRPAAPERVGTCLTASEGKIIFAIYNL